MNHSTVKLIKPKRFADDRGWFSEVYNSATFAAQGIEVTFVQDNHSLSRSPGTLRGLHYQAPPHGQAKLVRCIRGRIFDVAVDIRKNSPTFGHWVGAELSAENSEQLFIPVGFAHGFVTLEPDCEITYKVSEFYAATADGGLRWDDADLAIKWPLPAGMVPVLSQKDVQLPRLAEFDSPFAYDGCPLQPLTF